MQIQSICESPLLGENTRFEIPTVLNSSNVQNFDENIFQTRTNDNFFKCKETCQVNKFNNQ